MPLTVDQELIFALALALAFLLTIAIIGVFQHRK